MRPVLHIKTLLFCLVLASQSVWAIEVPDALKPEVISQEDAFAFVDLCFDKDAARREQVKSELSAAAENGFLSTAVVDRYIGDRIARLMREQSVQADIYKGRQVSKHYSVLANNTELSDAAIRYFMRSYCAWILPSRLRACNCTKIDIAERAAINAAILAHILENFEPTERITLTSFGSGSLLQEFLLVKTLVMLGYTNLNINLIDPIYDSSTIAFKVMSKKKKAGWCESVETAVHYFKEKLSTYSLSEPNIYRSVDAYRQAIAEGNAVAADVVMAIDAADDFLVPAEIAPIAMSQEPYTVNMIDAQHQESKQWMRLVFKQGRLAHVLYASSAARSAIDFISIEPLQVGMTPAEATESLERNSMFRCDHYSEGSIDFLRLLQEDTLNLSERLFVLEWGDRNHQRYWTAATIGEMLTADSTSYNERFSVAAGMVQVDFPTPVSSDLPPS